MQFDMEIKVFYCNEFRECCYVIWDDTMEAAIIDPGFKGDNEFSRLKKFISDKNLVIKAFLLTHAHFDHTISLFDAVSLWNAPVFVHHEELKRLSHEDPLGKVFGTEAPAYDGPVTEITDGQVITFGQTQLEVLETPGHTEGSVCFYNRKEGYVFTGDTLFAGSIGRTDFPGGDYDALMESIRTKLTCLDSDVEVLPGHGPTSNIGYELMTNPFIKGI